MLYIDIANDYQQIKIAQIRHVNQLIEKIATKRLLIDQKEIELDITGCITDYPSTPIFIDYFLSFLSGLEGNKQLHIKIDGVGNKEVFLLYKLILEGKYFGITDKIENEEEVEIWKVLITKKLKENNIVIYITYTPTMKEYIYGK